MSDDRCCCGVCHVKTGTWIIAILQFVFGVLSVISSIIRLTSYQEKSPDDARYVGIGEVVVTGIWLLMVVLLMIGLYKNKPMLILPHLIVTIIYVMLMVAGSIWYIVGGASLAQAISVACSVLIIFGLLWVEWQCYKYISSIA